MDIIDQFKNKIINADNLDVLKQIPDSSVDMIITDPPYMVSNEISLSRTNNKEIENNETYINSINHWDDCWKTQEDYLDWCKLWIKESVRTLKNNCHFVMFFDIAKISYVWEIMKDLNMKCRMPLFWLKTNPPPRGRKVDFMRALECALWFTKGKILPDYFNYKLGQQVNYVESAIPNNDRLHPTQKPEKPIEVWIKYLSKENDIILDPFSGSGTTCCVAKRINATI